MRDVGICILMRRIISIPTSKRYIMVMIGVRITMCNIGMWRICVRTTKRVIAINDGVFQCFAFKQARLGGAVGGHVAVIIEMIAREIGEERAVEINAGDAVLIEPDRGHFHCNRIDARALEVAQLRVQPDRVRCRIDERLQAARSITERTDDRAPAAAVPERLREPLTARRLAVGARDTDQIEMLAIERAKVLFGVPYANVQPYSGSPANSEILFALAADKELDPLYWRLIWVGVVVNLLGALWFAGPLFLH